MATSWAILVDATVDKRSRWHSANSGLVPTDDLLGDHFIAALRDVASRDNAEQSLVFCARSLRRQLEEYEAETRMLVKLADTGRVVLALTRALEAELDLRDDYNLQVVGKECENLQQERKERMLIYDALLKDEGRLRVEVGDLCQQTELQARLKLNLRIYGHVLTPHELDAMSAVFEAVTGLSEVVVMALPDGFTTMTLKWPGAGKSFLTGEERCLKNAATWSELRHPNVRKFYGLCHVGDAPFVIHEVCEPVDCNGFDWRHLLECARGMLYVHERGLVHEILTVNHLLFSRDGVKGVLSGLGLVWRDDHVTDFAFNKSESSQQRSKGVVDHCPPSVAGDVFALGIAVLDLLVRHRVSSTNRGLLVASALPNTQPNWLNDNEWSLLQGMCDTSPSKRISMQDVVYQMEALASQDESTSGQEQHNSWLETKVDVRHYIIPSLAMTIEEVLAEATELCTGADLEIADLHRPVLERLVDIYNQLLKLITSPRLLLVESFEQIMTRWFVALERKTSLSCNSAPCASRTIAGRNYSIHHDIDRLLREFSVEGLKFASEVHQWQRSWKEAYQRPQQTVHTLAEDLTSISEDMQSEAERSVPVQMGRHLLQSLQEVEKPEETNKAIRYCLWNLLKRLATYEEESRVLVKLAHVGRVVGILKHALSSSMGILHFHNTPEHDLWTKSLQDERDENVAFYQRLLGDKKRFEREMGDERQQREILVLLRHEMDQFDTVLTDPEREVIIHAYRAAVSFSTVILEAVPVWFATSMNEWSLAQCSVVEGGEEACARQANAWSELHHPNVRKFYGAYHVGKSPFVVHDTSSDLTSLELSESTEVWKLLLDLARGLQYVHGRGFVHQIISADNLQVNWEHKGVLSGMGLVRLPTDEAIAAGEGGDMDTRVSSRSVRLLASEIGSFGRVILNLLAQRQKNITNGTEASGALPMNTSNSSIIGVLEAQALEERKRMARLGDDVMAAEDNLLPDERPAYVEEAEWHLLTGMCTLNTAARLSMPCVISEMERLAGERASSVASEVKDSSRDPVPDITLHYLPGLNMTMEEALAEAKELSHKSVGSLGNSEKVYDRLEDVYKQLQSASSPVPASLVDEFAEILSSFVFQIDGKGSMECAVASTASVHQSSVHKNIAVHYDINELLDKGHPILDKHKQVHQWQRTSVQYQHELRVVPLQTCPEDFEVVSSPAEPEEESLPVDSGLGVTAAAAKARWLFSPDEVVFGKLLGKGSFGIVRVGTWLGSDVVVKQVITNQDEEVYQEQFLREANLWFGLNHMNLIRLYGAWIEGRPSFVCERAIHGTLEKYSKGMTRKEIWRSLYVAAKGLEYLHEHNIAHGDLKGNNILVCEFETVKLGDFGMSVILNRKTVPVKNDGSTMGAIRWKAPECLQRKPPSLASDIYSFGMCIVEALTKTFPWGKSMPDSAVQLKVESGELPQRPEDFSDTEWGLVECMCCLKPESRLTVGAVVNIAYALYLDSSQRTRMQFELGRALAHQSASEIGLPSISERQMLQTRMEHPSSIVKGTESEAERSEALALLQSEGQATGIREFGAFLKLPPWFIPPEFVFLGKHLADGSFGSVYEGVYFESPVVVKQVLRSGMEMEERRQFLHETDLWFALKHPNVIELYGACHEDRPFFMCERAMGGTIVEYARRNPSDVWRVLRDATLGVQYLHAQSVVHGDLKGNNILIGETGQAKVTDFGTSFVSDNLDSRRFAVDGAQGAIRWKAPEVLQGGRSTFASDIYSFGMCILEVVTGEYPWGKSTPDAMVKTNVAERNLLPQRPKNFRDAQWALVTRMCSYDPGERISVGAIVCILDSFCSLP